MDTKVDTRLDTKLVRPNASTMDTKLDTKLDNKLVGPSASTMQLIPSCTLFNAVTQVPTGIAHCNTIGRGPKAPGMACIIDIVSHSL